MQIILDGHAGEFQPGVKALDVVRDLLDGGARDVFALMHGGHVVELGETLHEPCELKSIRFEDEEGRRINERALRYILLLAVRRLMPDQHVRFEYSVGYGIYLRVKNTELTTEQVAAIEREMKAIVGEALPFVPERWSRVKAMNYFMDLGEDDAVRLLCFRPYEFFPVYECGGYAEYFYGAMPPSTDWVRPFALSLNAPGLVMQMPSPSAPDVPAPFVNRPKHLETFAQSNTWCGILGCTNAADLNDRILDHRMREFIRVNEALHDQSLTQIANRVLGSGARAVFVAGPSSSGKTTFARRLDIHLRVRGLSPFLLSLDDFYHENDKLPLESDGKPDLEAPDALDIPLFHDTLERLLSGYDAFLPHYNFKRQRREIDRVPMRLQEGQVLIIEGLHALNPRMHAGFDPKLIFRVFVSALTCVNLDDHNRIRTTDVRLLRRIVRDSQFRGTSPDKTLSMWPSVRRGEEKWIFPFQEQADIMFNTALHYELPILKQFAYDPLMAITPDNPNFLASRRLLKILHYFLPVNKAVLGEIPPLSILREFIGGLTLDEK